MKKLNIFISSPGDVQQERFIAKKVIADLNRIYSQYIELKTIMWEDLPLEATASFQEGIDYFLKESPIEIAIFILWSRLGSKLGQHFIKPDGTEYQSGTEYEFDMMYALWQQTHRPKIMVYVKDAEPQFPSNLSLNEIKESLEQKNRLQAFIEENFRDRETGTNYAYWQFDKQQTFEDRLRAHLTRLIHENIGQDVQVREWEGNPYVGLRSYEEYDAEIFCGRQSIVYDIAEQWLGNNSASVLKPLFVLGESGSGKSSLIKAGLIPYLHNMSTDKQIYYVEIMTPSEFRGGVYNGIVNKLIANFPDLENNPVTSDLLKGITPDYDFKYLQYALNSQSQNDVTIFFLDQFEELFSDNLVTEEERKRTLQLLYGLHQINNFGLIISMRNDFYGKFAAYHDFGALKNESLVVDIPNVSATDLADIVEIPAKKASLKWEINNRGVSLSKKLIQEAYEIKDLPLIEFGLSELYDNRVDDKLTFEGYEKMGRLKGAVAKYADRCYKSLTEKEKKVFEQLLGAVITTASQKNNTFVRKTALVNDIAKTDSQKALIKKLIDAHLFISGRDANGEPTITIAHEMLLSSWDVIKNWIESRKEFIEKSGFYENLAKVWDDDGRKDKDLIRERSRLLEAEYYMYNNVGKTSKLVSQFLEKSLKRQRGKGLAKYMFFLVAISFLLFYIILLYLLKEDDISTESEYLNEIINEGFITWEIILFVMTVFFISIHGVVMRILREPKYKTIKATMIFSVVCLVLFGITFANDIYNIVKKPDDYAWWGLLAYIPIVIAGINVLIEFRRRKLWKKGVFKTYFLADRFYKVKDYVIWAFVGFLTVIVLVIYSITLSEKEEQYEKTLEVADKLFDGFDAIKDKLSWSDQLYINELRLQYLIDRFADELVDDVPDRREGQVAVCFSNLYKPINALSYLYPDNYWDHELLTIKEFMRAGAYEITEYYLESYIYEKELPGDQKYWNLSYVSTHDLIWIAEKIGRFDLAEKLYELIEQKGEDIESNAALVLNYGHIQLMKGNIEEAEEYYNRAQNLIISDDLNPQEIESAKQYFNNIIANDFTVFHWMEVGDENMMNQAAEDLDIQYRKHFYTSVADSTFTEMAQKCLVGTWALADSSMVVEFHNIMPLCLYKLFDTDKSEWKRALTNCRYSNIDDHIYLEEFDQDYDLIYISEIIGLTDSVLTIKIIDNGDESDKESVRTFYKVYEDE